MRSYRVSVVTVFTTPALLHWTTPLISLPYGQRKEYDGIIGATSSLVVNDFSFFLISPTIMLLFVV